ncbi:MAG: hypothetical protein IGS03_18685 [Candidatus Sericytochromatia bacterium]|nr:hypothetical protein [Candidatus Sericytochromatia bacterium]
MNTLNTAYPVIFDRLQQACRHHFGSSTAHDGSPFNGELELSALPHGLGFQLSYQAEDKQRQLLHTEHSLIALNPEGQLCLWNLNSNLQGLHSHVLSAQETLDEGGLLLHFDYGQPGSEGFRERVSLGLYRDGGVSYTYVWGLPGEAMAERSAVRMYPTGKGKEGL